MIFPIFGWKNLFKEESSSEVKVTERSSLQEILPLSYPEEKKVFLPSKEHSCYFQNSFHRFWRFHQWRSDQIRRLVSFYSVVSKCYGHSLLNDTIKGTNIHVKLDFTEEFVRKCVNVRQKINDFKYFYCIFKNFLLPRAQSFQEGAPLRISR